MARADQMMLTAKRGTAETPAKRLAGARLMVAAGAAALFAFAHGPDVTKPGFVGTAQAQTEGLTTSKAVFDAYTEAQVLLDEGNAAGAAARVRRVLDSGDELNAAEQGILYRFLANVELERERYPQAIDALQRAVRTGAFEGRTWRNSISSSAVFICPSSAMTKRSPSCRNFSSSPKTRRRGVLPAGAGLCRCGALDGCIAECATCRAIERGAARELSAPAGGHVYQPEPVA